MPKTKAPAKKAPTKGPAKSELVDKPVEEPVEDVREAATEIAVGQVDMLQNKLVDSREYGDALRRESIARNRERRDRAQEAQTLRPPT